MKIKYFLVLCLLIFGASSAIQAQHFIGMHKEQIATVMSSEMKTFKLNKTAINRTYKYLKYEDSINEMTMLFFLSEDDHCTLVRLMCDYSNINDKLEELETKYKKTGSEKWEYTVDGEKFEVILEEGEWFFTITTRKKK